MPTLPEIEPSRSVSIAPEVDSNLFSDYIRSLIPEQCEACSRKHEKIEDYINCLAKRVKAYRFGNNPRENRMK